MDRPQLLLVDPDPRSLRVLEVSLRKAGYGVAACSEPKAAIEAAAAQAPDLVVTDTRFADTDGFALVDALRRQAGSELPVIFLSGDAAVESKVRALELGIEDFLVKPIFIREIIACINLVLQRRERSAIERSEAGSRARFTGSIADVGLVDLLQTIDAGRKSGVLRAHLHGQSGAIYFSDGRLLDAELGPLRGETAVYRMMLWADGEFEIDFRSVRREPVIATSTQGVLMEGMRLLEEWARLLPQVPPLAAVIEVDAKALAECLQDLPDEVNLLLRDIDGQRSLGEALDAGADPLNRLVSAAKLNESGLLIDTGARREPPMSVPPEAPPDPGASTVEPGAGSSSPAKRRKRTTVDYDTPGASSDPRAGAGSIRPSSSEGAAAGSPEDTLRGVRAPVSSPPRGTPVVAATDAATEDEDVASDTLEMFPGVDDPIAMPSSVDHSLETTPGQMPSPEAAKRDADQPISQEAPTVRPSAPEVMVGVIGEHASWVRARRKRRKRRRISMVGTPVPGSVRAPALSDAPSAHEGAGTEPETKTPPDEGEARPPVAGAQAAWTRALEAETEKSSRVSTLEHAAPPPRPRPPQPGRAITQQIAGVPPPPPPPPAAAGTEPDADGSTPSKPTLAGASGEPSPPAPTDDAAKSESGERRRAVTQPELSKPPPMPASAASSTGTSASTPSAGEPAHKIVYDLDSNEPDTLPPQRGERKLLIGALVLGLVLVGIASMLRDSRSAPNPPLPVAPPSNTAGPRTEAPVERAGAEPPAVEPPPEPQATKAAADRAATTAALEQLVGAAQEAEAAGDRARAVELYEQALVLAPTDSPVLSRLSLVYLNRGDNARAMAHAERAVTADATNSEGWIVLGAARAATGDHKGAREAYRRCAEVGVGDYVAECRRMLR